MIPLHDNIPSRTFPFVNYGLIAICSVVFLLQVATGEKGGLVEKYGMIPARVVHPDATIERIEPVAVQTPFGIQVAQRTRVVEPAAVPAWLTLLTCIFLHGGWMHAIGNLWFLHIFGDNVEDRLGHLGYLLFYLVCGIAASATHLATGPNSTIPTIGASGAIAGVMGAYFLLYPKALVVSLIPIIIIFQIVVVPAPIFLGIWFLIQFFQGTFSITQAGGGGVAWWAHIGGFVVGTAIAWGLKKGHFARPPVEQRSRNADRVGSYRAFSRR